MRPINHFLPILALVLSLVAPAAAAVPSIVIDGARLPADVPALVSGDHVLVPLRGVFEHLGARVSYDASTQTAAATLNGMLVQVSVGSRTAWVNGQRQTLDVVPREVAGRIMIPLRFVAQALGVSVDYDGPSDTVVIVSGQKPGNFAAMTSGPDLAAAAPKHAPSVEDERPNSGSLIGSQYPSIYARFNGGSSAVNPSSVTITVDGNDVTGSSTISSSYVSYTPGAALQSGQHTVSITGTADDGTPFSTSWSFRVDAGTSSDYTVGSYGGGMAFSGGGFDGFGFPARGFGRFGFSPPGFSVFTPGPLFFVSGNIIEVIFVSQFFPFGNAFFTISGFPGSFPLTPWLGCPGFFWGFVRVPFGMTAHNAVIAARFTTPGGRKIIVRSTAPMQIEGQRKELPADLRYAVLPRLINRPTSPRHAVAFERVLPPTYQTFRPGGGLTRTQPGGTHAGHPAPVVTHPAPIVLHPGPVTRPLPVLTHPGPGVIHPAPVIIHPVIHPVIRPPMPVIRPPTPVLPRLQPIMPGVPMQRFPMTQWQQFGPPAHPVMPNAPPAKPK